MTALLILLAFVSTALGVVLYAAAQWRHRAHEAERSLRVEQSATPRAVALSIARERSACVSVARQHGADVVADAIRNRPEVSL